MTRFNSEEFMFKKLLIAAISVTLVTPGVGFAKTTKKKRDPSSVDRPPQFVLLAFDGSKDIAFWDESMAAADTFPTKEGTSRVRWTYFINPTYYLSSGKKTTYNTPGHKPGKSCIGFSNTTEEIAQRIARTNKAFKTKHEIASHANSHCEPKGANGVPWGQKEWMSEFSQFNTLLFDAFKINGIKPVAPSDYPNGFSFSQKDIVGFRAPLLAQTPGLWPTLKAFNFRYDTSKSAKPDYWPQRQDWGGWNFPLAQMKIAGTSRTTLSMDYNWFVYQTGGVTKKNMTDAEYNRFYTQMLDSYKYYFKKNYFGNRAPVHIGHHFSKWNRGVYWQVMKDFSKFVCNKPEVRCVTYVEYANWLDGLDSNRYEAYRKGNFERMRDDNTIKDIATPVLADIRLESGAGKFEAVIADADKAKALSLGWKPQIQVNMEHQGAAMITREELAQKVKPGESVILRASILNRSGADVNWETYKITNFGTEEENLVGPLEDQLLQGETAEAHESHENE